MTYQRFGVESITSAYVYKVAFAIIARFVIFKK